MTGNELFSWKEVGEENGVVIAAVESTKPRLRIDQQTAEAMAKIQREIVEKYPHQIIRLLINTKGMYLDAGLISHVIRPEFIFQLASLSRNFDVLILHSGYNAIYTIAKALSGVVRNIQVTNLDAAEDEEAAIELAKHYREEKKPGAAANTSSLLY